MESSENSNPAQMPAAGGPVVPRTIQPQAFELVGPVEIEKVLQAVKRFEEFKEKVIGEDDYSVIAGKRFINKNGLMKYAMACNLSFERLEERREVDEKTGVVTYHFVYRAVAPNGRFSEAVGSASTNEKGITKTEHNTRALAQTRATNRATSNLVAAGQVSAEEVDEERAPVVLSGERFGCNNCTQDFPSMEELASHHAKSHPGKSVHPVRKVLTK